MAYADPNKAREYLRQWKRANPDLVRAQRQRQQARILADPIRRERRNAKMRVAFSKPETKKRWYEKRKRWLAKNKDKWTAQQKRRLERNPWLRALVKARFRAKASGLENTLTNEWAAARYTGNCEVTGLPFVINGKTNSHSISLDRIDSSNGYTPNNCRFVLWAVNRFKGEDSDEVMLAVARAIVEKLT